MKSGKQRGGNGAAAAHGGSSQTLPGRSLWVYLVPVLVVAVVIVLLLAAVGQQQVRAGQQATAERGMRQMAELLASQVAGTIDNARVVLQVMAADPRVAAALAADEPARTALAAELQNGVSQWLQLRLLPLDWDRPESTGAAPMGYAGVDLVRRAASGRQPDAEVHQLKSRKPYVALAMPAKVGDQPAGVLFAALPLSLITSTVDAVQLSLPGRAWLTQRSGGKQVALGVDAEPEGQADGTVEVPGTILGVTYRADPAGDATGLLLVLSLTAVGIVVLILVGVLQWRRLAADLRTDMGTAVILGEAIHKEQGMGAPTARLRSTADALMLLAKLTQTPRNGPKPKAGATEKPAMKTTKPVESLAGRAAQDAVKVEEVDENGDKLSEPVVADQELLLPERVFRAYDIRGLAGDEINPGNVTLLGQALGSLVQERGGSNLVVARDARISSRELATALIDGIVASGTDVIDLGAVPTPLLYFARQLLKADGAVMVTGSHNPPEYNGFKIQLGDDMLAEGELAALRARMAEGNLVRGHGASESRDLQAEYVQAIVGDMAFSRDLRVVIDAGNGIAGPLAVRLFETLGCEVIPLYCDPDGSFPNHHPDPSQPENLTDLVEAVRSNRADLGIAFDGDGDRVALVDNDGHPVWPDQLLMLLAADVLIRHPGADIIYDVKSSRHLASYILANGGRPIMWKSGHSRMKAKLRETGALLAGEFAGHYYIKERWYGFDDGLYTAARALEILSADAQSAADVFAALPVSPATPELVLTLEEGRNVAIMRALAAQAEFPAAKVLDIDGVRVEFDDGWGLVRASNTTPALVFRFEAQDETALERIQGEFRRLLAAVDPNLQPPF